jgi:hypothetical protein
VIATVQEYRINPIRRFRAHTAKTPRQQNPARHEKNKKLRAGRTPISTPTLFRARLGGDCRRSRTADKSDTTKLLQKTRFGGFFVA